MGETVVNYVGDVQSIVLCQETTIKPLDVKLIGSSWLENISISLPGGKQAVIQWGQGTVALHLGFLNFVPYFSSFG